jgi:hypothetical protein
MIGDAASLASHDDVALNAGERLTVIAIVRHLDRVAFIPRDLVLAAASRGVAAAMLDQYRATGEDEVGAVRDAVWRGVVEMLCDRARR